MKLHFHFFKRSPIHETLLSFFQEDFSIIDSGSGSMFYHPTNHHPITSILQVSEWKLDQKEGLTISRSIWLLCIAKCISYACPAILICMSRNMPEYSSATVCLPTECKFNQRASFPLSRNLIKVQDQQCSSIHETLLSFF